MVPRLKVYFSVIFCVLLLTSRVCSSAVIEALEEHLKDIAHNEGIESIKHDKEKAEKVHQIENTVNDSHKNQYSKATDDAKYVKKDHDLKSSQDSDEYQGYNAKQDKAEDTEATGYKRGHKKGHHKEGFQNSYHKDESSNKSTYFDDISDEGDQAAYNSRKNSHDNHGGRSYYGAHNNGQEILRDNYQGGGYNRHGEHGNKHLGHQDYGKKYYLDDVDNYHKYHNDENKYNRGRVHDRYDYHQPPPPPPPPPPPIHHHYDKGWDWDTRRDWNRPLPRPRHDDWNYERGNGWDYGGPGFYDDHDLRHDGGYGIGPRHGYGYGYDENRANPVAEIPKDAPVVAHRKQTITIYEDPRYDGKDKGQLRREEGDHLQLDFQPSGQRYAAYDDTTYYKSPKSSREGEVESSKINRLVYNYKRQ